MPHHAFSCEENYSQGKKGFECTLDLVVVGHDVFRLVVDTVTITVTAKSTACEVRASGSHTSDRGLAPYRTSSVDVE
jgi:hypothetical protein